MFASFKVAASMAWYSEAKVSLVKVYTLSATNDAHEIHYGDEKLNETEETEEDANDTFYGLLPINTLQELFTLPYLLKQNSEFNRQASLYFQSGKQLFMLYQNFRI
ncbi:hypothetical protein [Flectobacillus major]|jgi:hypothetical protein|uniref:hypothetical protein n=1 Tax=Flectobacillus major TaxID=103 RepID=UPI000401FA75|nr:hypothetical protein [Flectobacillus major]